MFRIYPPYLKAPHNLAWVSRLSIHIMELTTHPLSCMLRCRPKDLKNLKSITEGKLWSAFHHPSPERERRPENLFCGFATLKLGYSVQLSSMGESRVDDLSSLQTAKEGRIRFLNIRVGRMDGGESVGFAWKERIIYRSH